MQETTHLFTIEGEHFALGLFWQPLSGGTAADRKKELRTLAAELTYDLAVIRQSSMVCAGFANSKKVKAKTFSAAAIVSKTLEMERDAKDFIFVSALPDGRWMYVAQRDGAILPDGDMVFSSEDAARSQLMEHMSLGDWGNLIAPDDWGVRGSTEKSFADLLPRKKNGKISTHNWWRLIPVKNSQAMLALHARKIVIGVAGVAAVGFGGHFYQQWKARQDALAALRASMSVEQAPVAPPEHPWKNQPQARDVLRSCIDTLAQQNLFPGNWGISGVECSGGALTISWKPKEGGWIKHLKEIVPDATIAMDGSTASVRASLPAMAVGLDEAVTTEGDRLVGMYSAAQTYGVKFTVSPAIAAPTLPGQGNQIPPDWREVGWQAQGVEFPEAVLVALDGPGFRMRSMHAEWKDGKFVWVMEGTQYVQP